MAKEYYVVYKGKVLGAYNEWHECQAQVNGFSDTSHKGFKSRQEGEASYLRFTLARAQTEYSKGSAGRGSSAGRSTLSKSSWRLTPPRCFMGRAFS